MDIAGANRSGGLGENQKHFGGGVRLEPGVLREFEWMLYDPQTSGGLLIAAGAEGAGQVERALAEANVQAKRIGVVEQAIQGVHVLVGP